MEDGPDLVAVDDDEHDATISLSDGTDDSSMRIMSEVDVSSLLNDSFEENQDKAIEYTNELHIRAEKAVRRIEELEKSLIRSEQVETHNGDDGDDDRQSGNVQENFDIILGLSSAVESSSQREIESVEESSLSSGSKNSEGYDFHAQEIAAYRPSNDINLASTDFNGYNSSRQSVLAEISEEVQDIRTALGIKSELARKIPTPPRSAIKTRSKARQQQLDRVHQLGGGTAVVERRRSSRRQHLRSTGRSTAPFTPER